MLSFRSLLRYGPTALNLSIAGFGLFGFIDAAKYYLLERNIRGDFGDDMFLLVLIFVVYSFVAFFIGRGTIYSRLTIGSAVPSFMTSPEQISKKIYLLTPIVLLLNLLPLGSAYGSLINISSIGFFTFVFICLIKNRNLFLALIIFIIMLFLLFSFGYSSRRIFIAVSMPFILILIAYSNLTTKIREIVFKFFAILFVISIFLFLNFMRSEHNYGRDFVDRGRVQNTIDYIVNLRSVDTFWNTAFIVDNFPHKFHYYYGETYASVPVGFIPRSVWQNKPVGLSAPLGIMQKFGFQESFNADNWKRLNRYSLSPGLLGEAYANFGIYGILFVPIMLGFLSRKLDFYIQIGNFGQSLNSSLLLSIFFLIHRGDAYVATTPSIFLFLGATAALFSVTDSKVSKTSRNVEFAVGHR